MDTGTLGTFTFTGLEYDLSVAQDGIPRWFVDNEWHRYVYAAVSGEETGAGGSSPGKCIESRAGCLILNAAGMARTDVPAFLIGAGPALPGQTRDRCGTACPGEYFEPPDNAAGGDSATRAALAADFNDQVRVVGPRGRAPERVERVGDGRGGRPGTRAGRSAPASRGIHPRRARDRHRHRGLSARAFLAPLRAQIDAARVRETERMLGEIREALIGYAIVRGALPCPDVAADGDRRAQRLPRAPGRPWKESCRSRPRSPPRGCLGAVLPIPRHPGVLEPLAGRPKPPGAGRPRSHRHRRHHGVDPGRRSGHRRDDRESSIRVRRRRSPATRPR